MMNINFFFKFILYRRLQNIVVLLFCSWLCFLSCDSSNATPPRSDPTPPDTTSTPSKLEDPIYLADPTIFYYKGVYYLYGTHTVKQGFVVYTSTNLKDWKGPSGENSGFALRKEDVYGNKGFWAPQVFRYENKFYMAYTANSHIAIAKSNSPLGPFKQGVKEPIIKDKKAIDPFVFIGDNGTKYLYYVRLKKGNRIYVGQVADNFTRIIPNTVSSCINAVDHHQSWENLAQKSWTVTEGPSVLRHNGHYYLFYSANGFKSIYYAVGYAVSNNPTGPWKKYNGNPILNKGKIGENGPGHGDFVQDSTGQYYYVFHTHYSGSRINPRRTAIIKGNFVAGADSMDEMKFDQNSFHYFEK